MKKQGIVVLCILSMVLIAYGRSYGQAPKIKLYSNNNGVVYMRSTEIIYKDHMDLEGGGAKKARDGHIFAQIVLNFANLSDKSGAAPVTITLKPESVVLVNEKKEGVKRKLYSGVQATKLLKKSFKPFIAPVTLKPGEDVSTRTMCFLIPKTAKIIAVMYKLDKADPVIVDFRENPNP
ncbi:MAG: hypothetical protein AB2L14_15205 [Candidatus Xenobiia bacterium LiM19]